MNLAPKSLNAKLGPCHNSNTFLSSSKSTKGAGNDIELLIICSKSSVGITPSNNSSQISNAISAKENWFKFLKNSLGICGICVGINKPLSSGKPFITASASVTVTLLFFVEYNFIL
jgi:hypothetical protein